MFLTVQRRRLPDNLIETACIREVYATLSIILGRNGLLILLLGSVHVSEGTESGTRIPSTLLMRTCGNTDGAIQETTGRGKSGVATEVSARLTACDIKNSSIQSCLCRQGNRAEVQRRRPRHRQPERGQGRRRRREGDHQPRGRRPAASGLRERRTSLVYLWQVPPSEARCASQFVVVIPQLRNQLHNICRG